MMMRDDGSRDGMAFEIEVIILAFNGLIEDYLGGFDTAPPQHCNCRQLKYSNSILYYIIFIRLQYQ
jgi:hypothetical protein